MKATLRVLLSTLVGTIAVVLLLGALIFVGFVACLGAWVVGTRPVSEESIVKSAATRTKSNSGDFAPAAPLCAELRSHEAYLLQDGKVLLVGRDPRNELKVQLFDPMQDTITLAPDEYGCEITKSASGLMSIGGHGLADTAESRNKLVFRALSKTPILKDWQPDIVSLPHEQILLAGGSTRGRDMLDTCSDTITKVVLYDAATNKQILVGRLNVARGNAAPAVLKDGRILFTGGDLVDPGIPEDSRMSRKITYLRSTEIYNPRTRRFTNGPLMKVSRSRHRTIVLADGRVLVIGGLSGTAGKADFTHTAEIYDPKTNSFGPLIPMSTWRLRCQTVLLPSGNVLVMGVGQFASDQAELFDAINNKFIAKSMILPRLWQTATVLNDGRVFIAGGLRRLAVLSDEQDLYAKRCELFVEPKSLELAK